jgi:hypothetical protein
VNDPTFSRAFRRTVLVSLRKSGTPVESPYSSMFIEKEKKLQSEEEEANEEDCAFTKLEIRQVIRYTEDCCDDSQVW